MTVSSATSLPALSRPETVQEALNLLHEHGDEAKVVAGGTAFTIGWKAGLLPARHLISCTRIGDLHGVREHGVGEHGVGARGNGERALRIGAVTRLREVERDPLVRERAGVLAATMSVVANVRVRNAATMGGNLAEADYSSDPPCVLTALGGRVRLESRSGARWVDLIEFFTDYYQTAIRPDELLTEVEVPVLDGGWRGVYLKYTSRSADDRTCLGVAAFVVPGPGGTCAALRLCAAGAGPTPLRLPAVEERFAGRTPGDDELDGLAEQYAAAADPVSDARGSSAYRTRVLRLLVPAAVRAAFEGRQGALVA